MKNLRGQGSLGGASWRGGLLPKFFMFMLFSWLLKIENIKDLCPGLKVSVFKQESTFHASHTTGPFFWGILKIEIEISKRKL